MAETFDDAVELGRVQFARPFDGAYGIADRRLCIENALKRVNAQ